MEVEIMNNVISDKEKISFTEVYDIIMFLEETERNKIPKTFIEFVKANKQNNCITKINPYMPLDFQKISKETQSIIAYIYRRYLASEEEKEDFKIQEQKEFESERKQLEENYNTFFNKKKIIEKPIKNVSNLPVVVEKENIFKRLVNFIKNAIRHKN